MLVEHLQRTLSERSKKNPRYSLRAFARSLGMDSSTLSAIMRGKRPLTAKTVKRIIENLEFKNEFEAERILLSSIGAPVSSDHQPYSEIELDKFEAIGSWEHFAILALCETSYFRATEKNIAKRLGLEPQQVSECMRRLERLNLVKIERDVWKLTKTNLATPSNIPNKTLRKNNRQYIEKALESLEVDSVDERDITGITMAIDSSKLEEAKTLIKEFRRKMASFLETGTTDEVYRLNIQLFPLTKKKTK